MLQKMVRLGARVIVRKLPAGILPYKASSDKAGYQLFFPNDVYILSHETTEVDYKIQLILPKDTWGIIRENEEAAFKGIMVLGSVLDRSTEFENVTVNFRNVSYESQYFKRGECIANLYLYPMYQGATVLE